MQCAFAVCTVHQLCVCHSCVDTQGLPSIQSSSMVLLALLRCVCVQGLCVMGISIACHPSSSETCCSQPEQLQLMPPFHPSSGQLPA
eukprot:901723-Rhodomonas_salina.2